MPDAGREHELVAGGERRTLRAALVSIDAQRPWRDCG